MNFPYVLSDEILLRSKYEKKKEKKLRSKWLSVTIEPMLTDGFHMQTEPEEYDEFK